MLERLLANCPLDIALCNLVLTVAISSAELVELVVPLVLFVDVPFESESAGSITV